MKKRILILSNSYFISGAEISLIEYLENIKHKYYDIFIAESNKNQILTQSLSKYQIIKLPFKWFVYTHNPFKIIGYFLNILYVAIKLKDIVIKKRIDIIYSNSIKSQVYGLFLKLLTGKKIVWHVRDNLKHGMFNFILIYYCDKILCNSNHIYRQVNTSAHKKILIYSGINTEYWSNQYKIKTDLRKKLGLNSETLIVGQIGQITRWKNQLDFVRMANIILSSNKNVHFLIVGDDQSGEETKYYKQLKNEITTLGLANNITLTGYNTNIREIYAQINILVHPAINEPFGRVLVEAMAMGKPVVAYNCGGPKEIIIDGETGYLVEPFDFIGLADKTIHLLENSKQRIQFGEAGRKRVVEILNLERYIGEMDEVFSNV